MVIKKGCHMNHRSLFFICITSSLLCNEPPQHHQVTIRTFDEITVYPTSDEEEHRAPQLIQAIRDQIGDHRNETISQKIKSKISENKAIIISNIGTAAITGTIAIILNFYGKQC
jgi:hypothetical protein